MKTVQVKISESDLKKYNLEFGKEIKFTDLLEKISLEIAKKAILECNEMAEEYKLSDMTDEEIEKEIKAVRDVKDNS
jgi:hypothetical protein